MIWMQRIFMFGLIATTFFSCKSSEKENKTISAKEFLDLYKKLDLPVNIADSDLAKFGDTTTIDYATFIQFIPDSALAKSAGNAKQSI